MISSLQSRKHKSIYIYSYYYIPIKMISFLQSRIALNACLSESEISRMNSYLVTYLAQCEGSFSSNKTNVNHYLE